MAAEETAIKQAPVGVRIAGLALPVILLLFVVVFSVLQPDIFPTASMARTILRTESVAAILAIALIFPLVIGEFDVSIAAVLGLGAILVTGLPSLQGVPLALAVVLSILACATVGLINGLLIVKVGINALVATLGISVIVTGLVYWYTNGGVIYQNIPKALPALAQQNLLGIPLPAIFLAIVATGAWYVLECTPLGRYLYAIGGSKEAARLSGINVDGLVILAYVVAGVLAGLAGILQAAQLGSGNPNIGPPFLLPAFAAAYLGATAFRVNTFNVPGTIVAVFTVAVGITGLQLLGIEFFIAPIFQGVSLILAVIAVRYLRRERLVS
ncbi:MAG: ABC transporter permease [Rhizobiaceae bacterium]